MKLINRLVKCRINYSRYYSIVLVTTGVVKVSNCRQVNFLLVYYLRHKNRGSCMISKHTMKVNGIKYVQVKDGQFNKLFPL